jgi:RND family efflux transporter MFP subunit
MLKRRAYPAILLLATSILAVGCGRKPQGASKPEAPAKVANPPKETQLNTIELTQDAEKKLGLQTAAVEERAFARQRPYAGEVTLPGSALLTVSAPVSGTLKAEKGQDLPQVGAAVRRGQVLFTLVPHALTQADMASLALAQLQLKKAQIDAMTQVDQALVQLKNAKIDFDRFHQLVSQGANPKKDEDDARAKLDVAEKAHEAAVDLKKMFDSLKLDKADGLVKPLPIPSPRQGLLRTTFAVPGETVPAGAPLFEIMNVNTVWIKVPVYAGELADIADHKPVQVNNLSDPPGARGVTAKPVPAPPTAQAQASAVDLYYELGNTDGKYRPGQRVGVLVPLKDEAKSLAVPWSAVVHDINGGTWVYVQTKERTYARQRVQVKYVTGDHAVLEQGPRAGTKVVTAGAAEVFGAEFGFGR